MHLSDSVMLGATMIDERNPHKYLERDIETGKLCGCAIGMGCLANGEATGEFRHKLFPWLLDRIDDSAYKSYDTEISDRFRILCGVPGWAGDGTETLEKLVDWIRSVEPECGECNRFNCTCVKAPEAVGTEVLEAVRA